ncbi:hypothetical protein UA08_06810 [Talaromyces atroroseus]|uniref:AB hydrolase-1 domain-containing protein n=1 Tax=Talaromyces atroroseus TaxID=1441469 RepID=A0A225AX23_TALAT|nr:hypothetical protein UA08_06810 [Talaromyces atroroseus]OKL58047.1 hypothetical protein UA08_06810 [Talaromyces atroroseus]
MPFLGVLEVLVGVFGELYGRFSRYLLSFTVCRLILVAYLLPVYVIKTIWTILPTLVLNLPWLFTSSARSALIKNTEEYRKSEQSMANLQLDGHYRFPKESVYPISREGKGWMHDQPFSTAVKDLSPRFSGREYAEKANCVLTWQSELEFHLEKHWIGHGRSDKVTRRTAITFELHMRTLVQFFEVTGLEDAILVAHDWGGLLYIIWFLSTGIMGGYLPEAGVMRYMSPHLSQEEIDGYSAPYSGLPVSTKASVFRFGHMVPGLPRFILLHARHTQLWKLLEGLCGPVHFSSVNAQARLAERDNSVRPFWATGDNGGAVEKDPTRVLVVFGDDDPLLKSYKDILSQTIHPKFTVDWAPTGIWLPNAGHYATEEKAKEVLDLVEKFSASK